MDILRRKELAILERSVKTMKRDNDTKTRRIHELERRVETDKSQLKILSENLKGETTTNSVLKRQLTRCRQAKRSNIVVANLENGRLREKAEKQKKKVEHLKEGLKSCQRNIKGLYKLDKTIRTKKEPNPKLKL